MNQNFYEAVEDNPIIAAVKSMEDVEECCKHDDIRVIFILFGEDRDGAYGSHQWFKSKGDCS